ncbi:type VI secretion system Vgr family protein [Sorangium sp. So ce145]|uniref:type VI secretion system Vgr family protein n=1 Tax=Sorangium sp. So ce145 TaxID=3133285 RepID=UPI003F5DC9EC
MATATLVFSEDGILFDVRALVGRERLGEPTELDIEALSTTPVEPAAVLGKACLTTLASPIGARSIAGTVVSFTAIATSQPGLARRYRIVVRSTLALLELRQRPRIFQQLSVPDVVKQVIADATSSTLPVELHLSGSYSPREYIVQYAETDAAFVRRLCEEEGLYFRFLVENDEERVVLEDSSTTADDALGEALPVTDAAGESRPVATASNPRVSHRRRVGKVTLRDYKQQNPRFKLEAVATAGRPAEQQEVEVYEAPGRFLDPDAGNTRARTRLEGLRANAEVWTFETTALALAPGLGVTLAAIDLSGTAQPEGEYFVVAVRHQFRESNHSMEVEAIPRATPYRLPRITPRPRIHGIHSAWVTGAAGEEIHVDAQGRVRVKFHWDLSPGADEKSSLPIRVMQPNTPGAMVLPRVGWEVLVAFEDGDPDRPYILGRAYNAKQPPPYALPANKTVTVLGTSSSPGGGRQNQIRFDDAAGRQNISFAAGFGKSASVGNNMVTQTVKNEALTIEASQSRIVGANEDISVTQGYSNTVGSQSALVGATQKIYVKGNMAVGVGSETVVVGGACLEKVGNPVTGALNLAKAAALQGAGALGAVGGALATAYQLGEAGYRGYQAGGLSGAVQAVGTAGASRVAERFVPGGGQLLGALSELSPAPWAERAGPGGPSAAGGGATAASDTGGPAGPGPGHRNTTVRGVATELVGAAVQMTTPGTVSWSTIGASTFLVGGSHHIKAGQAGARTLGASNETLGSLRIETSGDITRDITGPITTTVAGSLKSKASGKHNIKAGGALKLTVGGPLKLTASKVTFVVGGSTVTSASDGLLLDAGTIKFKGKTNQKKDTGHS